MVNSGWWIVNAPLLKYPKSSKMNCSANSDQPWKRGKTIVNSQRKFFPLSYRLIVNLFKKQKNKNQKKPLEKGQPIPSMVHRQRFIFTVDLLLPKNHETLRRTAELIPTSRGKVEKLIVNSQRKFFPFTIA
jgi:hypothetical protein